MEWSVDHGVSLRSLLSMVLFRYFFWNKSVSQLSLFCRTFSYRFHQLYRLLIISVINQNVAHVDFYGLFDDTGVLKGIIWNAHKYLKILHHNYL